MYMYYIVAYYIMLHMYMSRITCYTYVCTVIGKIRLDKVGQIQTKTTIRSSPENSHQRIPAATILIHNLFMELLWHLTVKLIR